MRKYIQVVNNKIIEIFETDQDIKSLFHPSLEWIECKQADVKIGYVYNGAMWVDDVQQTTQDSELERVWRNSELIRADIELNKVQDTDSKAVGSVAAWRDYRKALRAWPENVNFPVKNSRPKAPDAKE